MAKGERFKAAFIEHFNFNDKRFELLILAPQGGLKELSWNLAVEQCNFDHGNENAVREGIKIFFLQEDVLFTLL